MAIVLNRLLLFLGCVGLFVAGVLSASHYWHLSPGCGAAGGCESVLTHASSKIGPVPVAYLGLMGYLILTGFAALRAVGSIQKHFWTVRVGYLMSGIGFLFSIYLQFVSIVVIQHICPWCLASAITMLLTMIAHGLLFNEGPGEAPVSDPKGMSLSVGLIALALVSVGVKAKMIRAGDSMNQTVEVQDMASLIPPNAHTYGNPASPIKIVEFADLLCSHCQEFSPTVRAIVDNNPGKVCLVYRHFPLDRPHPMANIAACVSEYAAEKMDFFKFADAIMNIKEPPKDPDPILNVATQFQLDVTDIRKRLKNPTDKVFERVEADVNAAHAYGVNSTPTFVVFIEGNKTTSVANHVNLEELLHEPRFTKILNAK